MDKIHDDRTDLDLYYGAFHALKDVNLNIAAKRTSPPLSVPRGCGKIHPAQDPQPHERPGARLHASPAASLLDGQDIYARHMDVNLLRKRVGMVFQKPNPFPMSVYDNIAYGPRTHGIRGQGEAGRDRGGVPAAARPSGMNSRTG